jgi:hypothetical protein
MARWNYERCCWLDADGTPLVDYEPTAQDYERMAETLLDMPKEEVSAAIKTLPDKELVGLVALDEQQAAAEEAAPE